MKERLAAIAPLALALLAPSASAQTMPEVGARALGMGGAYVAVADGPTAAYWNPAAIPLRPTGGAFVYGRATIDPEGLSERLDDLAATNALSPDIVSRPADAARAIELLGAINSEPDPISGYEPFGGFWTTRSTGVSIYRLKFAQATPLVDTTHVEISNDPTTGLPYNDSRLVFRSLDLDDYVFSFAFDIGDPRLLVGGSVRYSRGETDIALPSLFDQADFSPSDVFDSPSGFELSTSDSAWSYDFGTLATLHEKFRVGVIGKWLGSPEFDVADETTIELDSRWRSGIAIFPSPSVTLSADVDLTTSGLVPGAEETRFAAGGAQVLVAEGRVALRGGYRGALEGPGESLVTGGVGFVAGAAALDAAIGWAPSSGSVSFMLEVGFGKR